MWHLLTLPFVLLGALVSGVFAAVGVALVAVFVIPLILLAVVFRAGFFFLKVGLVMALLAVVLVSCI